MAFLKQDRNAPQSSTPPLKPNTTFLLPTVSWILLNGRGDEAIHGPTRQTATNSIWQSFGSSAKPR